jgi:hypothetical protein
MTNTYDLMLTAQAEAPHLQRGRLHLIHDGASAAAAERLPRSSRVKLAVPGLDTDVASRIEWRLNASLGECGCRLSAQFLVGSMCAFLVVDMVRWSVLQRRPIAVIAAELLIAFLTSGMGRWIAISRARHTLRTTLSTVLDAIDGTRR